jgi:hypothetical protein
MIRTVGSAGGVSTDRLRWPDSAEVANHQDRPPESTGSSIQGTSPRREPQSAFDEPPHAGVQGPRGGRVRYGGGEMAVSSPAEEAPGIFAGQLDEAVSLDQGRRDTRLGGPRSFGELRTQADEVGLARHAVAGRRPGAEIPDALSVADPEAVAVGGSDRAILSGDDELVGALETCGDRRCSKTFDQRPICFIHSRCLPPPNASDQRPAAGGSAGSLR